MFWQALTAARDLGRLHEIAAILIRYGFGAMVRNMGLARLLEKAGRALHWEEMEDVFQLDAPTRVRRVLEELGPTFVKLGQVFATRVDIFDPEWIAEFSKLQDSVPAVPYEDIRRQLEEDLGAPPETLFAWFDEQSLAAASVAQVHRARLDDGSEVVVKVRRPGIRPQIEADLRWLSRLALLIESETPELRQFHPVEIAGQFAQSLRRELDFAGECRNAERIAENFVGYVDADTPVLQPGAPPLIVIPRVHWEWTSERVAVLEYIDAIPGRQLDAAEAAGLDRKLLARRGAHAVLKMVIEDGLFHADPHPGNLFYLPGNRMAFIDFGMVGRLTEERRDELTRLLFGMFNLQPSLVTEVMLDWAGGSNTADESSLTLDVQTYLDQYHGLPLKHLKLGAMLTDFARLMRQHHLTLPPDLVLLFKTFISLEGMGREIDPEFDIPAEMLPMLKHAIEARYAPWTLVRRGWRSAAEGLNFLGVLPGDLNRLMRRIRRGKLDIHVEVNHIRRVGDQFENAVNRLAQGLIVAALIIGSSIIVTAAGGPALSTLGIIGFVAAALGGLWVIFPKGGGRR
ncbi:AarF/ABC1/UbiB kinase family protein [Methylococcus sp. EFPC2]|uniref:ABC1 kinase family protein n=1 Tax=Methylococcus sp. EFPC2 TaxID=2812648 RepID=UPI0019684A12|nr:AarF/UbiB family protein [Methylococcus sp. EFPC2]QSA97712.1 ubiquinone biosynthesis protein UbiB [Methylococcus sp. EFPC2]